MTDLLRPCPFCGARAEVWETFGRLVAGCRNQKCNLKPDTWLTAGEVYDVRSLAKHWNQRSLANERI
jgi:hypothetical protein